ncbi:MAG: hypothetical protein OHK0046_23940 [Anaerolineae bacterium]
MLRKLVKRFNRIQRTIQQHCQKETFGSEYGGWTVCVDHLPPTPRVYAFGVGEDITFDLAMIERFSAQVYAFDPTPRSINWVKEQVLPPQFSLLEFGLEAYDGHATFYPPSNPAYVSHSVHAANTLAPIHVEMKRLSTIMQQLGHTHIDVLKMDIEGSEYAVIDDLLSIPEVSIGQLLVEFHPQMFTDGIQRTNRAIKSLNRHGYRVFHVAQGKWDYSFIRESSS